MIEIMACLEIMHSLRCIVIYTVSFILTITLCDSWEIRTYEFTKQPGVGTSELNPLSCARAINKGKSCGCKKNADDTYDVLWKEDWYMNPLNDPTYTYIETFAFMKPDVQLRSNGNWLFHETIPMCMNIRSVVELNFTLDNNWTIMNMYLRNRNGDRPLMVVIRSTGEVTFRSKTSSEITKEETVIGSLFQMGNNYMYLLKIKVLETSFKVFVNDVLIHEFHPNMTDLTLDQIGVWFFDVLSDLYLVRFRQTDY